jgi:zinc transport system permease protein
VRTIEFLSSGTLFWPGVVAALAVGALGGLLAPIVVARRLAFVGQGVSHAAFGGVGVAAWLGAWSRPGGAWWWSFLVVGVFCLGTALGISWVSGRRGGRRGGLTGDTAIGVFLVGSMALGAVLLLERARVAPEEAARIGGAEAWLFGRSLLTLGWMDAAAAWAALGATALVVWRWRRSLAFWAVDEAGAEAFGVPVGRLRVLAMVLLGVAVLVSMRLAGALLATSVLVLPGAAATLVAGRFGRAVGWSVGLGVVSALAGIVLSFEADWPAGPSIVAAQVALVGACWGVWRLRGG